MDFTKLQNALDRIVTEYHAPGVDCQVYIDHQPVFRYFAGMRDAENKIPMDGNELYLIFSMTKMLTCTGALQLLEKGAYRLDDPISKYLPEFAHMKVSAKGMDAAAGAKVASGKGMAEAEEQTDVYDAKTPITVKHLFTMGAGLDYVLNDEPIKNALAEGKKTTRELVGAMAGKVLGFEPGTRYRYSLCHDVLGALIEIWSGQKFGEYMKEHVFDPIGMTRTFFGVPKDEERLSQMAARYTYQADGYPKRLPIECYFILTDAYESGGAGLTSCTEDYARFLDMLACGGVAANGNRILKEETVMLMQKDHLVGEQKKDFDNMRAGYGYGLGVRTHINPERSGSKSPVGEFGWDGAAGAFSMVDIKHKVSLTYFQHVHNWGLAYQQELKDSLYDSLCEE
ncbi:MAG: beta-lactamase family protein [Clostridia bacterium]|nr:beta-lactamase family protein [Clostridia bacterium]